MGPSQDIYLGVSWFRRIVSDTKLDQLSPQTCPNTMGGWRDSPRSWSASRRIVETDTLIVRFYLGSGIQDLDALLKADKSLLARHHNQKRHGAAKIYSFIKFVFISMSMSRVHIPHSSGNRGFLVTHAHLDHINALVIQGGSLSGSPKYIYALDKTLQDLESHVFNDSIWPNLGISLKHLSLLMSFLTCLSARWEHADDAGSAQFIYQSFVSIWIENIQSFQSFFATDYDLTMLMHLLDQGISISPFEPSCLTTDTSALVHYISRPGTSSVTTPTAANFSSLGTQEEIPNQTTLGYKSFGLSLHPRLQLPHFLPLSWNARGPRGEETKTCMGTSVPNISTKSWSIWQVQLCLLWHSANLHRPRQLKTTEVIPTNLTTHMMRGMTGQESGGGGRLLQDPNRPVTSFEVFFCWFLSSCTESIADDIESGLKIYVTHFKDVFDTTASPDDEQEVPHIRETITSQIRTLVNDAGLGAEIVALTPGMCLRM